MKSLFNLNSEIFKGVKEGKISRTWFAMMSPIIIIAISIIPLTIIGQIIYSFVDNTSSIYNFMPQISLILSTGINILACFFIVKVKEKRSIKSMGFGIRKKAIVDYLEGFAIGIIMIGIAWVGIILFGDATFTLELDNLKKVSFIMPFLLMLLGWIIQGASEEIMMRGYMMPVLGIRVGPKFAVIFSSIFFSALHLMNSGITVLSLINLTLFGFFAAFYTIESGNLWGICALHSAWNFAQQNIFGTLVSGGIVYNNSLINTKIVENNIINGGTFGPEGGIIVTMVLVIGILALNVCSKEK